MADILLVEDDEDIVFLVEMLLSEKEHVVRIARDGAEGLMRVDERLPDLVVMDIEMPRLSGPAMAERLFVENLGRENVPIVIVSGAAGLAAMAARVGTPYYLAKPFSPEALMDLVARALSEQRIPRPPL